MYRRIPDGVPAFATVALLAGGAAAAPDPDAYDPLLDGGEAAPHAEARPWSRADPRAPGFLVGGGVGLYGGAVRSYLTSEESRLDGGLRPGVGIGIGYRTRSPVELGVDLLLGLGRSFEAEDGEDVPAYDLLVEPRLLWHFVSSAAWGAYGGAAGSIWLYDVERAGLSQAGLGPGALLGATWPLGDHGRLFVEAGGTALYDFLAYEVVEPTPEELLEDPEARPYKDEGAWYFVGRLMVGYRLGGF